MPKTVASRGSEQVAPMAVANPYERPKEVGTRWSQEEDRALRAAIEQHTKSKGPSWPLIAQTLGQLGFDRTSAMCRNRLSRMNADTSSSTRVCSLKQVILLRVESSCASRAMRPWTAPPSRVSWAT